MDTTSESEKKERFSASATVNGGSSHMAGSRKVAATGTPDEMMDAEMDSPYSQGTLAERVRGFAVEQPVVTLALVSGAAALLGSGVFGARTIQRRRNQSSVARSLDSISEFLSQVKDSASDAGSTANRSLHRKAAAAEAHLSELGRSISEAADEGWQRASSAAQERPLVSGAIAVGAALAIGKLFLGGSKEDWRVKAGRKGGSAVPYEERSYQELYKRARELQIDGRSSMSKKELIEALRARN